VGDFIGDLKHHGGDRQAVYAVAREELDWWGAELGRSLDNGLFGENLTTAGLDVDAALIGERWQIGDVVLEVTGPRVPCATFSIAMGVERWVQRFSERGRTGAYLAIIAPGTIGAGDAITVLSRPSHGVDVPTAFRATRGDTDAVARMHAAGLPIHP
jgi:MOSC domain-containing protein YiiM